MPHVPMVLQLTLAIKLGQQQVRPAVLVLVADAVDAAVYVAVTEADSAEVGVSEACAVPVTVKGAKGEAVALLEYVADSVSDESADTVIVRVALPDAEAEPEADEKKGVGVGATRVV